MLHMHNEVQSRKFAKTIYQYAHSTIQDIKRSKIEFLKELTESKPNYFIFFLDNIVWYSPNLI